MTVIIALVTAVAISVVVIAALFKKISKLKTNAKQESQDIGFSNSAYSNGMEINESKADVTVESDTAL